MANEMEKDIKGPAQTGDYPAYSFQKNTYIGKRDQEIRDKIKFTKEELNQVLNQLNEFDNDHKARRRDTLDEEEQVEDDDMADLSPETRQLMERVLNKKNTEQINPMNPQTHKQKQLTHMMSLGKKIIDTRASQSEEVAKEILSKHHHSA